MRYSITTSRNDEQRGDHEEEVAVVEAASALEALESIGRTFEGERDFTEWEAPQVNADGSVSKYCTIDKNRSYSLNACLVEEEE